MNFQQWELFSGLPGSLSFGFISIKESFKTSIVNEAIEYFLRIETHKIIDDCSYPFSSNGRIRPRPHVSGYF